MQPGFAKVINETWFGEHHHKVIRWAVKSHLGWGFVCLFALVHLLYFIVTTVNRSCKILKQKYEPQTKSFRSTFRMLCPANHSGCAQLTFTEWWKLLSTSHWSSHFKWQSQSKLLVFRTLQKERKSTFHFSFSFFSITLLHINAFVCQKSSSKCRKTNLDSLNNMTVLWKTSKKTEGQQNHFKDK